MKLNIVEKWQMGLLGTLLFRTCRNVQQGMLTHRLLINHHRKRSTIRDSIFSGTVALNGLCFVILLYTCVLHLTSEEDHVEARSLGSACLKRH